MKTIAFTVNKNKQLLSEIKNAENSALPEAETSGGSRMLELTTVETVATSKEIRDRINNNIFTDVQNSAEDAIDEDKFDIVKNNLISMRTNLEILLSSLEKSFYAKTELLNYLLIQNKQYAENDNQLKAMLTTETNSSSSDKQVLEKAKQQMPTPKFAKSTKPTNVKNPATKVYQTKSTDNLTKIYRMKTSQQSLHCNKIQKTKEAIWDKDLSRREIIITKNVIADNLEAEINLAKYYINSSPIWDENTKNVKDDADDDEKIYVANMLQRTEDLVNKYVSLKSDVSKAAKILYEKSISNKTEREEGRPLMAAIKVVIPDYNQETSDEELRCEDMFRDKLLEESTTSATKLIEKSNSRILEAIVKGDPTDLTEKWTDDDKEFPTTSIEYKEYSWNEKAYKFIKLADAFKYRISYYTLMYKFFNDEKIIGILKNEEEELFYEKDEITKFHYAKLFRFYDDLIKVNELL